MDDLPETQQAEKVVQTTGKTGFGVNQFNNPTPMWVTWIFRTEFVLNKAALFWLSATSLVAQEKLKEVILILTVVDFVVWGLGRFIGITRVQMENK